MAKVTRPVNSAQGRLCPKPVLPAPTALPLHPLGTVCEDSHSGPPAAAASGPVPCLRCGRMETGEGSRRPWRSCIGAFCPPDGTAWGFFSPVLQSGKPRLREVEQVAQGVVMPSWETTPRPLPEEDVPAPSLVISQTAGPCLSHRTSAPGPVCRGPCNPPGCSSRQGWALGRPEAGTGAGLGTGLCWPRPGAERPQVTRALGASPVDSW